MGTAFCLAIADEWTAHDPFGRVKPADAGQPPAVPSGAVALRAPRGGYASFRLLVRGRGRFRLSFAPGAGLELRG